MSLNRSDSLQRLSQPGEVLDMIVIGGGATGASVALDAAARGFKVALLEQHDFGKGTSSRSTKLVHGGVRYLAQGNLSLVRDALLERTRLRENAPHVVHEMSFIVPCANRFEKWWYRFGFTLYDALSGTSGFRKARAISQAECLRLAPTLKASQAQAGVLYSDGQFDDSRLLLNILQTAAEQRAIVLNYARVVQLLKNPVGKVEGVSFTDAETSKTYKVRAKCVVNATGPFCDAVRRLDQAQCEPIVSASQGVHLVLKPSFLPGNTAVIVPKTSDGRVIFMIPWHGHVLVGTTDTPIASAELEPKAKPEEIDFLLATAGQYLTQPPTRADILSVFTGIRPLVGRGAAARTSKLSRDHATLQSESGLLTITGGKWTTARRMGEDCVDKAILLAGLAQRPCRTRHLKLHGAADISLRDLPATAAGSPTPSATSSTPSTALQNTYGIDRQAIDQLALANPQLTEPLVPGYSLNGAEVVWAVRHEMARTVEDVLARRNRLLFLNADAAESAAPEVARWMARELGRDSSWEEQQVREFEALAKYFRC
jgi:glycerol-3-phosphate dehydrogenase